MKLTFPNSAARHILLGLVAAACMGQTAANAAEPPNSSRKPHYYGQVKAYCIGIDKYDADGIPPLTSAESEAKTIHETLQQKFGYSTELLIGSKATKATFDRIVEDARTLGKNDALIIFFGGHGEIVASNDGATRTGFLIPVDARLNIGSRLRSLYSLKEFREQAIEMKVFAEKLKALPVGHVLLVADACHSGVLAKRGGTESQLLETILVAPSRTVITSAGQNESARDGVFGVHFNNLLTDAASKRMATSTDTLFRGLFDETVKSQSTLRQIPQIAWFGDDDGRFVFFPIEIPPDEIADLKQRLATKRLTSDPTAAVRGIQADLKQRAGVRLQPKSVVEAMTTGNYWYGNNTEEERKRWQAKREAFLEGAKFGDPVGLAGLFFCTKRGFGGLTNPFRNDAPGVANDRFANEAFKIALQAADANDRQGYGKFLLGLCYLEGIGTAKRDSVGQRLIEQAASNNNPLAILHRVAELQAKLILPKDKKLSAEQKEKLDRVLKMHKQLHDLEIPKGMLGLANAHLDGVGGYEKSIDKVEEMLTRAASTGDPESMLALAYFNLRMNKEKSRELLNGAADSGYAESQIVLARELWQEDSYEPMFGFQRDRVRAAKLYRDAADQDYAPAFGAAAKALSIPGPEAEPKLVRTYLERGKSLKIAECFALEAAFVPLGRAGFKTTDIDIAIGSMQRAIELGWTDANLIFELHSIKGGVPLNEGTVESFHWAMLAYKNCKDSTPPAIKEAALKRVQRGPMWLKESGVYYQWKDRHPETFAEYLKLYPKEKD